jgi:hypothetical protein
MVERMEKRTQLFLKKRKKINSPEIDLSIVIFQFVILTVEIRSLKLNDLLKKSLTILLAKRSTKRSTYTQETFKESIKRSSLHSIRIMQLGRK